MMDSSALEVVALNMFEQMGFLLGEPAKKNEIIAGLRNSDALVCEVEYSGAKNGKATFITTPELGGVMAQNILGMEPGDAVSNADTKDALKEFVNVLGGNLLTEIYGNQLVFNMGVPVIREINDKDFEMFAAAGALGTLKVEGSPVVIKIE